MKTYELMAKGVQVLTDATTGDVAEKGKNAAEAINEFYNKPELKAAGYILGSVVVIAVVVVLAVVGYKAWAKRQARKYNKY